MYVCACRAFVYVCNRRAPIILSTMNYVRTPATSAISVAIDETFRTFRVNFGAESSWYLLTLRGPEGSANCELILPKKRQNSHQDVTRKVHAISRCL